MNNMNLASPKHIKGSYNENHDLMAKEFYWLVFEKFKTFEEMKIWHHAFMEIYLRRNIDNEEADEWFHRGLRYFDIKVNSDIKHSQSRRAETKLKTLEREGKSLAYSEKDVQIMEKAQLVHQTKNDVYDLIREKTTKQPMQCRVFKEITFNFKGKTYRSTIEI
jgi:hypothetical protein